jgi:Cd2+/Zn2+-exporting ATPase
MGNREMLAEEGIAVEPDRDQRARVFLAVDGRYGGSIIVSDQLKEDAVTAVDQLRKLGVNRIVMLTGDKKQVAGAIGRRLNLDQVYSGLLPDQKLAVIEQLEKQKNSRRKNVFVGDGINDAPALARAEIGVAMGGVASDAAIEAADIVLMTGQPSKLVEAINIARKTRNIIMQNVVLALGVKALIMTLGLLGFASMWGAVFADVGVALIATVNAIRAMH